MKEKIMNDEVEPRQLAPVHFDAEEQSAEPAQAEEQPAADIPHVPPSAADLQAVFDVPVKVQAVLGRSRMDIGHLMRLKTGDVVELDRRVGEPVDIFVNNRLIARGEVVLIDSALGVTLTEIVRQDR
ncbi:flagellar motor switch protein FliN [Sphingobium boeckii]|uniref:Flagellar motor switch protein FliN n=1 Tax=Sphingobium boeckii TaxID=1082345 RepID=A0A7W9AGV8_9SPHN|nr:flagellar motor switch protein FliN [Sphingobium boeckii]MBB5685271.1 flagellar motor switch protein FliN/FliY [Sphingobium boeckii]